MSRPRIDLYKDALDTLLLRLELAESEAEQKRILQQSNFTIREAASRGDWEFFVKLGKELKEEQNK